MELIIEFVSTFLFALILSIVIVPVLKKVSVSVGLIDRPNHRSVHVSPIPLTGGLAIAISTIFALMVNTRFIQHFEDHYIMLAGGLVLLLVGIIDDRSEIKPLYRLVIQFACAYAMAASGARIESLYGVFGIEEIPVFLQYTLTMVVIVGVVNGFNLMDGVDGLAGGLALIGFISFAVLSLLMGEYSLTVVFMALIGAIVGFLRFNLSRSKIFMGDGGSLFLGFILVVSGIKLLTLAHTTATDYGLEVLLVVIGIFLVPVLDSIRVYAGRMREGFSPFKADKSHLHHLFLLTGLSHKLTALIIVFSSIILVVISIVLAYYFPMTVALLAAWFTFKMLTVLLKIHKDLNDWKLKLNKMEAGRGATSPY